MDYSSLSPFCYNTGLLTALVSMDFFASTSFRFDTLLMNSGTSSVIANLRECRPMSAFVVTVVECRHGQRTNGL